MGAAWRLTELGFNDWILYERNNSLGGLASSEVDESGFTWDLGGHVLFSHYDYFDRVMNLAINDDGWLNHKRESFIWFEDNFIPYPFQYSFSQCSPDIARDCLTGLIDAATNKNSESPKNYRDWITATFGRGIAKHFMEPYNEKVWACAPEYMDHKWIGERVAIPNLIDVIESKKKINTTWGPNNTFRFPAAGGTGSIWNSVVSKIDSLLIGKNQKISSKIRLETEVTALYTDRREMVIKSGPQRDLVQYEHVINTSPLDTFVGAICLGLPSQTRQLSSLFRHSTTHVIGIGLHGSPCDRLATKSWMYFHQIGIPFYRATVFSNYSAANTPDGCWSIMVEVSESHSKRVDSGQVVEKVIQSLISMGFIDGLDQVSSKYHKILDYGYPTPFIERANFLDGLLDDLVELGIYSRGRFGAWKYEVSNQDHSFMQGVEAVDAILYGRDEITVQHPEVANQIRRARQ